MLEFTCMHAILHARMHNDILTMQECIDYMQACKFTCLYHTYMRVDCMAAGGWTCLLWYILRKRAAERLAHISAKMTANTMEISAIGLTSHRLCQGTQWEAYQVCIIHWHMSWRSNISILYTQVLFIGNNATMLYYMLACLFAWLP